LSAGIERPGSAPATPHDERPGDHALIVWKGRVLVDDARDYAPVEVTGRAFAQTAPVVPVFAPGRASVAAYILEAADESAACAAVSAIAPGAVFSELMRDLGRYDAGVRTAIVRAIAIERWSNRYRFCPVCSTVLRWTSDAIAKICTNVQVVHRHFPRLDPAIIVLVTDGDRALLGRSPRFPAGFYSTLAGFVEPGECVEDAVRREVFEEAGIRVGAARYFGSEAWPFPRSLMLGFFAEAQSAAIELNDAELEDARWFDAAELRALQARMKGELPFFDTIARRLIDSWLARQPAP
jgi:NAD+ diphosphatase